MPLDAVSLVQALAVEGDGAEGMLVVGLDRNGDVCGVGVNPRHRALSFVKVWELGALADELEACSVVVALFRRDVSRPPTAHELAVFVDLRARALRAQHVLHDCLLVRRDRVWSLRELTAGRTRG